MDRNTFTGFFLIMIVLGGWFYFIKPNEAQLKKEREVQRIDSLKRAGINPSPANTATLPIVTPALDSAALSGPFGGNLQGTEATSTLENEKIKVNVLLL